MAKKTSSRTRRAVRKAIGAAVRQLAQTTDSNQVGSVNLTKRGKTGKNIK